MGGSEDNVVDMPTKEKVEASGRNVSVCQSCGEAEFDKRYRRHSCPAGGMCGELEFVVRNWLANTCFLSRLTESMAMHTAPTCV